MKISLFFVLPVALLAQGTQSSGPIVLDSFQSLRQDDGGLPLWQSLITSCATVTSISNGVMKVNAPSNGSCTQDGTTGPGLINLLWFPQGGGGNDWGWATPCTRPNCQYTQSYATTVPPGTDWTSVNRLYWTLQSDTPHGLYPNNTSGGVQIGYYVRSHNNSATSNQGAHYYSFVDAGVYPGQTLYFVMNRKPQHNNQGSATDLYPEDPEWNACCNGQGNSSAVHWWDGDTTFYFAAGPNLGSWTGNFTFGKFTLATETYAEPDDFVSALSGTFTGPNASSCCSRPNNTYEVQWQEAKLIPGGVNYHMYYSSAGSMHVNGLSSGTSNGTVRGPDGGSGAAYMQTYWNSPVIATPPTNMWVAIRPDMPVWSVTGTSPITVTTRSPYDRHWLKTGDQVTVANLCSTANGTRTVTVVDNFTVSLGVSGSCSYSGYTGTGSATMTATSNTANFTEILIGPGTSSTSFSPCDLNQDGVVNTLDYNIASSATLNEAPCTANINGSGICNVVTVQRVSNAATGGACVTGP